MTAVPPGPAIEVDGLTKAYGGRRVLDGVSFAVARGETLALLGPNGAGKTTTAEIVEGFRRPEGGTVRVLGTDPLRGGRAHRARVGIQLQDGGIDPRMTAREALDLHGRFHAERRSPDVLLALVGLARVAGTRARRLSGGERRRLGLALALVGRPEVVVLDEPTAGLDVEARGIVRSILAELRRDGVTVLLASHDLAEVERVADRIAILDRGRIVVIGSPAELGGGEGGVVRVRFDRALAAEERAELAARLGPVGDEADGRYRLGVVAGTPDRIAELAAWCAARGLLIVEVRVGGASLEERYRELIGPIEAES